MQSIPSFSQESDKIELRCQFESKVTKLSNVHHTQKTQRKKNEMFKHIRRIIVCWCQLLRLGLEVFYAQTYPVRIHY